MTMQEQLDALRNKVVTSLPLEVLAVVHGATEELERSGLATRAKGIGDSAPSFALADTAGALLGSADLLRRGPLILSFYRGNW